MSVHGNRFDSVKNKAVLSESPLSIQNFKKLGDANANIGSTCLAVAWGGSGNTIIIIRIKNPKLSQFLPYMM